MGMLEHSIAVMIVMQNGNSIIGQCGLDNEEMLDLTMDASLFCGCKKSAEIPGRILKGFQDSEGEDAEWIIRDSDIMGNYAAFEKKVSRAAFSKIHSIVLMSCAEEEYGDYRYTYTWIRYDLKNDCVHHGTGTGNSSYDAEKYLKELSEEFCGDATPDKDSITATKPTLSAKQEMSLDVFGNTFDYFIREDDVYLFDKLYPKGITITEYKGSDRVLIIPESAGGYMVRHIASLGENTWVEDVVIPEGISVSPDAFNECPQICKKDENGYGVAFGKLVMAEKILPRMVLPQGCVTTDDFLFEFNDEIEEVVIPEGMEEIGFGCFSECKSLRRVQLPNSLKKIADCAFQGCSSLAEVNFPENLSYIGEQAFLGCRSLDKVTLSPSTECAPKAFSDCSKKLAREDGITCICNVMYDLILEKHLDFYGYSYRNHEWHFSIPEDVRKIAGSAIFNAPGHEAESFTITDNVDYIDPEGFLLSGIKLFRIVDHVTHEVIFETNAFRKSRQLSDSSKFESFCELVGQKNYAALRKQFSSK